ncbi:MAG: cation-translocating P-type ATPase [Gemmataceae bacterium]|nr:cation-translocating P-type ATPase [Gemmataceae bacterium]MCI0740347.1 cation-translocating P-type ATPase [Gemmataceae bacterium]
MRGLSAAEVAERVRQGQVNRLPGSKLRDYGRIVARNLFTWFNAMVTPAAIALFYLGDAQAGVAVSAMALINTSISLAQEIRAKYHLDKLAILVETKARVLRDGQIQEIPAGDVVLGDCIETAAGETIVADGPVLESNSLEVDEALLTGESDPVRRNVNDMLLSGSFCVAGEGIYRADKVGREAFANKTSVIARKFHAMASPLTQVINRLVQILSYTAVGLIAMYALAYILDGAPKDNEEKLGLAYLVAATITSMVPQGMVLTATISFSLGALYMSRRGAVVQRLNAVETMAAIDVICTDKTGTLTTNHLKLESVEALDEPAAQARDLLRVFASASLDRRNKNLQAIKTALGETPIKLPSPLGRGVGGEGAPVEVLDQIPFKSQNRYSAVRVRLNGTERVLVLGAAEGLRGRVAKWQNQHKKKKIIEELDRRLPELQRQGLRVLLMAEMEKKQPLADKSVLPEDPLRPLALVCLSDELRPEAGQVLEALAAQGIDFKVVSGDNPETVQGTVSHLNLPLARDPVVTGQELASAPNRAELIRTRSVFGRVAPEQKVEIVETLQKAGCHVAMIGDGVNDVLPIKRADLGIAMGEGSQASKTVSGLVLENNNFALLPETLEEGRTIVRNLRRSAKLFLVKNVYSLILILAYLVGWFGVPFPYFVPQQVTLLNWLVIGIPAFVIAISRERSRAATKPRFLREVGSFALRTGIVFGIVGFAMLLAAGAMSSDDKYRCTMLLSTLILLGITALFRALTDGEPQSNISDRRYRILGLLAIPVYLLAMYWPLARDFFKLHPLGMVDWGMVLMFAGLGYGLSRWSDILTSSAHDSVEKKVQ